ncbi:MAG: HAMP domain-containing histidine kinase, partial [Chitinophagaceae bacterium]|nr:HAMP domain-containing histidine kinase [Chitinophagaceae bacterium]
VLMRDDSGKRTHVRFKPKDEIVSTINIIRNKLKDSLKANPAGGKGMVTISMNQTSVNMTGDSIRFDRHIQSPSGNGDRIFSLLYGVDSLQETLRLSEIDSAYTKALQKEKLDVPFSITQADSSDVSEGPVFNEVTVGLAKPVTYKLRLGNTFPYLLKQITQPILFSVLLLGITILSFVLLYRNLLKQQRLGALKNEFISNITHELKTPIATVGVAIEALKNFNAIQDPARTKEYLDISANELQRLNLLVDKVLKLSMFEKKEVELKIEPVNLREVAEEVIGSLKLQLEKNNAQVTITAEGDMTVPVDRLHLLSVIFNLVDNALKYSKQAAFIKIELQEEDKTVELKVTDNGIGIPAEYKDKVFDKFFRIPHGDTHNAKG